MSGFTPGPWFNGRQMSNSANAIIGDGDSVVAILPGAWNHCTHIEADARLIAAAPDLLAALQSAREWHRGDKWRGTDKNDAWQAQADLLDDVIAKATGAQA